MLREFGFPNIISIYNNYGNDETMIAELIIYLGGTPYVY